jgi:phage terminase small subunit
MRRLTDRQRRFVEEYLICLCATKAARRAGYSAKNADKIGPRLRRQPRIADVIERTLAEHSRQRREQDDARRQRDCLAIMDRVLGR